MRVMRADYIPLDAKAKVVKDPQGFVSVLDAIVSRTGVFEYRDASGNIRREYRSPSEVGKQDSLNSFAGKPITNLHPRQMLNPRTAKSNSVGSVGDKLYMDTLDDGTQVVRASRLNFHTQASIDSIRSGRLQLSKGYYVNLEHRPGRTDAGEAYTHIQKDITGNHIALVDRGRAGPLAAIPRVDGAHDIPQGTGAPMDPSNQTQHMDAFVEGSGSRWRVRRGDPPFEVLSTFNNEEDAEAEKDRLHRRNDPRPQARDNAARRRWEAFQEQQDAMDEKDKRIDSLERQVQEATRQLLQAQAERDTFKAQLEEAKKPRTDQEEVRKLARERINLERKAQPHLDASYDFTTKSDLDIKKAVISKLQPKIDLNDRPDAYIDTCYEVLLDLQDDQKRTDTLSQARASAPPVPPPAPGEEKKFDSVGGFAAAYAKKQSGRAGIDRIKAQNR